MGCGRIWSEATRAQGEPANKKSPRTTKAFKSGTLITAFVNFHFGADVTQNWLHMQVMRVSLNRVTSSDPDDKIFTQCFYILDIKISQAHVLLSSIPACLCNCVCVCARATERPACGATGPVPISSQGSVLPGWRLSVHCQAERGRPWAFPLRRGCSNQPRTLMGHVWLHRHCSEL